MGRDGDFPPRAQKSILLSVPETLSGSSKAREPHGKAVRETKGPLYRSELTGREGENRGRDKERGSE